VMFRKILPARSFRRVKSSEAKDVFQKRSQRGSAGRNSNRRPTIKSDDWLADGIRWIDDQKGNIVQQLPKSEEISMQQAREDFLRRDAELPGPMTIVYRPKEEPKLPPPAPRSIEELVEYIENTRYIDLEALSKQPDYFQDTVHSAWHVLARNPYYTENQKKMFMTQMYEKLDRYKDSTLLDDLLEPPAHDNDDDPNTSQKKKKVSGKK